MTQSEAAIEQPVPFVAQSDCTLSVAIQRYHYVLLFPKPWYSAYNKIKL